jgi:hypothetical protein
MNEMLIVEHRRDGEVLKANWYHTGDGLEVMLTMRSIKEILSSGYIPCSSQLIKDDVLITMFRREYK